MSESIFQTRSSGSCQMEARGRSSDLMLVEIK
ncbi:MAG: hypothetical protein E7B11_28850 [Clostridiales bacterium]|nr:hypothetical protein [Clostridiales bacterium]